MRRKICWLLLAGFVFTGCYYDKEEVLYPSVGDCSTINPKFAADIMPIVQSRCAIAGCHDASSGNKGGPLTNYTEIKFKASVIKSQVVSGAMPQGSSLTAAQIKLISCWVDSGSPNN